MVKWRRDANRDEAERRVAEAERQRHEESDTVAGRRADMQHEIANLRAEVHRLHELQIAAGGEALGVYGDKICGHLEKAIQELQSEVFSEVARKFGEAMGRLDALVSGAPSRSKEFRFANEDDSVTDLPNPLRKGMN
jgi:hypothetical protein